VIAQQQQLVDYSKIKNISLIDMELKYWKNLG
jgi:hypothetical protein